MTTASDWQRLHKVWYRKRDVYDLQWPFEPDRMRYNIVTAASNGGVIATVRNEKVMQVVRGNITPEITFYTAAGRKLGSTQWPHTGLIALHWTESEELLALFSDGTVRTFSVFGDRLLFYTLDDKFRLDPISDVSFYKNGFVVVTKQLNFYAQIGFEQPYCFMLPNPNLSAPPHCFLALEPQNPRSNDVRVLVSADVPIKTSPGRGSPSPDKMTSDVILLEKSGAKRLNVPDGPYVALSTSSSGQLLAALSKQGVFKVFKVDDMSQPLDIAEVECRSKPRQMVWLADDCIAIYLTVQMNNSIQHVVFVGGPHNDWLSFEFDYSILLVPEVDGIRIITPTKNEFLQRVPQSTEAIFATASCEPPAMLCYALERFEAGDVRAEESLRAIQSELPDAIEQCMDAAEYEFSDTARKQLLHAAVFGQHFLEGGQSESRRFIEVCRDLRICRAIWQSPYEIPMTVGQLHEVTLPGLIARLSKRCHHLLAMRICEWVGLPTDQVLMDWATQKIKLSVSLTADDLLQQITAKCGDCPGFSYAQIAKIADKHARPELATMFLDLETRSAQQRGWICASAGERLLLRREQLRMISSEVNSDDSNEGIDTDCLALEKAVTAGDPDLISECLSSADDVEQLAKILSDTTLARAANLHTARLRKLGKYVEEQEFYAKLNQLTNSGYAVLEKTTAMNARRQKKSQQLRLAGSFFQSAESNNDPDATFAKEAVTEQIQLMEAQLKLEETAAQQKWPGGPHQFNGSLYETLNKLIRLGENTIADKLKDKFHLSEKAYWKLKVKSLAESRQFDELSAFASHRSAAGGYGCVVQAFITGERPDLAMKFIPKVKDNEEQARYYTQLGMHEQASLARQRASEQPGAGALLGAVGRQFGSLFGGGS